MTADESAAVPRRHAGSGPRDWAARARPSTGPAPVAAARAGPRSSACSTKRRSGRPTSAPTLPLCRARPQRRVLALLAATRWRPTTRATTAGTALLLAEGPPPPPAAPGAVPSSAGGSRRHGVDTPGRAGRGLPAGGGDQDRPPRGGLDADAVVRKLSRRAPVPLRSTTPTSRDSTRAAPPRTACRTSSWSSRRPAARPLVTATRRRFRSGWARAPGLQGGPLRAPEPGRAP
jgi:hypothetical protein